MVAGRLKLSAIPLFIIAGVLLGPGTPGPTIVEHSEGVGILSELGIVLLLFFLGLEFSLDRLTQARRLVMVGGMVDLAICFGTGFGLGIMFFGVGAEAFLLAGLLYVSSSGIVTQALFDLRRLADDETDLTLGILVFEDLAIALFLAVAGALATGAAVGVVSVGATGALVLGFVAVSLVASRYAGVVLAPLVRRMSREQLFLFAVAIAVGGAALATTFKVSDAVGALLAGVLLSGTEIRDEIEEQLLGLRDFAAAIFFFAFGVEVDFFQIGDVWVWLVAAVPLAIGSKMIAGFVAARRCRFSRRQGINVGAALVARGEFSIILAQLAAAGIALSPDFRDRIEVFSGIFVLATAIVGVVIMRESRVIGRAVFPSSRSTRRRQRPPTSGVQRNG